MADRNRLIHNVLLKKVLLMYNSHTSKTSWRKNIIIQLQIKCILVVAAAAVAGLKEAFILFFQ